MTKQWKITIAILTGLLLFSKKAKANSPYNDYEAMLKLFLDSFTKSFGPLKEAQSKSIAQIVLSFIDYGDRDLRKLAYILGTAWHESKLILDREKRGQLGTKLYQLQEAYWYTGFYGRGLIQITHEDNYKRMGKALRVDLVNNPDLALDRAISADIAVRGMMEGIFTGLPLSRFINGATADYYNARKVVNRTDQAELIASYTTTIIRNLEYQIV
ncbi:MAG: hypothetical protein IPI96_09710 [Saprospiraceae bacterium]|nr:hypothetical protein [Saprospiraceae bacterium]